MNINKEMVTSKHNRELIWKMGRKFCNNDEDVLMIVDDEILPNDDTNQDELNETESENEMNDLDGLWTVYLNYRSELDIEFTELDKRNISNSDENKNDHFQEMFLEVVSDQSLDFNKIALDISFSSIDNLKMINHQNWFFYSQIGSYRNVSLNIDDGYIEMDQITWTEETLLNGIMVKLKKLPFLVKLFRFDKGNDEFEWLITNDINATVLDDILD